MSFPEQVLNLNLRHDVGYITGRDIIYKDNGVTNNKQQMIKTEPSRKQLPRDCSPRGKRVVGNPWKGENDKRLCN